jgi:hypothetical protein
MISVKWKVIHFAKPIVFAEVVGLLALQIWSVWFCNMCFTGFAGT